MLSGLDLRELALYPDCAVIKEKTSRFECCDLAVKSTAGRSYCYNDILYPEGTF